MKVAVFLLFRLISYLALTLVIAAALALLTVRLNGQCPPIGQQDFAVTCATRFSEYLANFGLSVLGLSLDTGIPVVLAVAGLIFVVRNTRRRFSRAPS